MHVESCKCHWNHDRALYCCLNKLSYLLFIVTPYILANPWKLSLFLSLFLLYWWCYINKMRPYVNFWYWIFLFSILPLRSLKVFMILIWNMLAIFHRILLSHSLKRDILLFKISYQSNTNRVCMAIIFTFCVELTYIYQK